VKKYLIAGLLVWLPLAVTIWVLQAVLGLMDSVFGWLLTVSQTVLPEGARATIEMLRHVPGLSLLVVALLLLVSGVFAANIMGQWWLRQGSRILHRIPIVKSIYSSVKQVSDTLFSSSGNAFREAVLVQYPRQGSGPSPSSPAALAARWPSKLPADMLSLYVPTTPNPTSGFFLMVPRSDVIELQR
jgi:uncharacterized membrane protein